MKVSSESSPDVVPAADVRDEIHVITHSRAFAQSRRHAKLLEYLCNKVLLGRQDEIKESTIALEVFDRTTQFDDKKDAIVRVAAHRLRERLAKYYSTEGAADRVVIEIAPGGYAPTFSLREGEMSAAPATPLSPSIEPSPAPSLRAPRQRLIRMLSWVFASLLLVGTGVVVTRATSLWHKIGARPLAPASRISPAPSAAGEEVRILAGSEKSYIDRAGHHWAPDEYYNGGAAQPGPAEFFGKPPEPSLFRSMRYGDCRYDIPLSPGSYELRLFFAEPTYRTGNDVGSEGGENQRHFRVLLNGAALLPDFDVVSDSGISPVDVRAFRDVEPGKDGYVHLMFQGISGAPFVNAVELRRGSRGRTLPIRIRAHEYSFADHAGSLWSPDDYYVGGRLATHRGDVTGTADPDLYASERYGNFSYAIPVPPGNYQVALYFAETYWDTRPDSSQKGGVGSRVFNILCNGLALLNNFDMLREAAPFQAIVRRFHNLRPNSQGKLILSFSPVTNYASVKAIQVAQEDGSVY